MASTIAIEAIKKAVADFEEQHPNLDAMTKIVNEYSELKRALQTVQHNYGPVVTFNGMNGGILPTSSLLE